MTLAFGCALVVAARSTPALAEPSTFAASAATAAGIAVVAAAGSTDAAWPLARSVYAEASLRPAGMDEARARALCGEVPTHGAPADIREMAEMVAALRGDDAPTRALLGDIARRVSAGAVVVVRLEADRPSARIFLADAGVFDSATYAPDDGSPTSWFGATRSLVRAFGVPMAHAPVLATHEAAQTERPRHREFYESGWFWGAIGAAAVAGAAVFLATRDSNAPAIHLHIEVSH
ncbi:MAG: hypothetical protein M3O46_14260 [Myxococcota bacterium]|nr:hypothetical protein [Myxococcota bacterium]